MLEALAAIAGSVGTAAGNIFGAKTAKDIAKIQAQTSGGQVVREPYIDPGFVRNIDLLTQSSTAIAQTLAATTSPLVPPAPAVAQAASGFPAWGWVALAGGAVVLLMFARR